MTGDAPLDKIEAALGHRFADRELLVRALTHSSRKAELDFSNERLEFLGDAILGAVVSDRLFRDFEEFDEGDLTRVKSRVVSRETLIRVARSLGIEGYLNVGKGVAHPAPAAASDQSGGLALPESLLSDAIEALIGAVYLDAGMPAASELVLRLLAEEIETVSRSEHVHNFKSALQQYAQRKLGLTPQYRVVSEEGPDHVKSFEVVALLGEKTYERGRGKTKKAAEQMAAKRTLALLEGAEAEKNKGSDD